MSIADILHNLKADDQQKFLAIRTEMRRTYLMSLQHTVGVHNYTDEDDTFLDAIDQKVEMLMSRAGIDTPSRSNSNPGKLDDPFKLITRPLPKSDAVHTSLEQLEQEIHQPAPQERLPQNASTTWGNNK